MSWGIWALILIAQNFAFTFVSRARNSGSLQRHMIAGIFSNGVWFASQIIIVSKLFEYISGKHGWEMMVITGIFYTFFTLTGSLAAHYWALHSEKGQSAVGASKKYIQITPEMWASVCPKG